MGCLITKKDLKGLFSIFFHVTNMCFNMMNGDIIIKLVRPTDYLWYMFSECIGEIITDFTMYMLPAFIVLLIMFPGA